MDGKTQRQNDMAYIISRPLGGSCGVGHQAHNWLVAWQLAYHYDLQFVHAPFCGNHTEPQIDVPVKFWEDFLGFGQNEIEESQLSKHIQHIKLPFLPWKQNLWLNNTCDNTIWKQTIEQHCADNVLFECSKNQFMRLDQPGLQHHILKAKYWEAQRKQPRMSIFDNAKLNVAIHIRRGDIIPGTSTQDRWADIGIYINIINQIHTLCGNCAVFHIYSDGTHEDLKELIGLPNIVLHLREDVFNTFHHMIIADIFVIGKSSFSALAGYLCNNIKIVQSWNSIPDHPPSLRRSVGPFTWEHLPNNQHFVSMDNTGKLDMNRLQKEMER